MVTKPFPEILKKHGLTPKTAKWHHYAAYSLAGLPEKKARGLVIGAIGSMAIHPDYPENQVRFADYDLTGRKTRMAVIYWPKSPGNALFVTSKGRMFHYPHGTVAGSKPEFLQAKYVKPLKPLVDSAITALNSHWRRSLRRA